MSNSKKLSRIGLCAGLLFGLFAATAMTSASTNDFRKFDDGDEDEIVAQVTRQTLLCNKGPLAIEDTGITNRTSEHLDKADFAEELREAFVKAGGTVHTKSHQVPASGTMTLTITSEEKQGATSFHKKYGWKFTVASADKAAKPCGGEGTVSKEMSAKP